VQALLPAFLVQERLVPELRIGDRFCAGLEVWCWNRTTLECPEPTRATAVRRADPQGHTGGLHDLVGIARLDEPSPTWVMEIDGILLAVNDEAALYTLDRCPDTALPPTPAVGETIAVHGTVAVAPDYLWNDLTNPVLYGTRDGRRTWMVDRITEHRSPVQPGPDGKGYPDPSGHSEQELTRIRRWADHEADPDHAVTYGVELRPTA
jgi:hypothetical protein